MSNDLYIQLPNDFEEQYLKYKAALLGEEIKPVKTEIFQEADKKYSDLKEPIMIKTLGIEISDYYISKGNEKREINATDKWLIYFLYYKFTKNKDECFRPERLVAEMEAELGKKTEKYIENRIGEINKLVKELIVKGRTNIGKFIKHEKGRGYHLNPKIVI
ncbi:MAG: hypothetical protein WAV15_03175 [Minisyncoccia bacterium]